MLGNLFSTIKGRVFYRFVEIFVISGTIGVLTSAEFHSLLPPILISVVASVTKMLREYKKSKEEN